MAFCLHRVRPIGRAVIALLQQREALARTDRLFLLVPRVSRGGRRAVRDAAALLGRVAQ